LLIRPKSRANQRIEQITTAVTAHPAGPLNDKNEQEIQNMKKWLVVAIIALVPVLGFAADTKGKQPTVKITDINKLGKLTSGYYVPNVRTSVTQS
jgi:hypothetical protein